MSPSSSSSSSSSYRYCFMTNVSSNNRKMNTTTNRRRRRRRRSIMILRSSSSSSLEKFALDERTISIILGPHEARVCSAWVDYAKISQLWCKKISQSYSYDINDDSNSRGIVINEQTIEALTILFCQLSAIEESVLDEPEITIDLCARLSDLFGTNCANTLRCFIVTPSLVYSNAQDIGKTMISMKRELPFVDVSNLWKYKPEILVEDCDSLLLKIRDLKETLLSFQLPEPCVHYLIQEEPGLILGDGGFLRLEQIRDASDEYKVSLSLLKFTESGKFLDVDSERWFINNFVNL